MFSTTDPRSVFYSQNSAMSVVAAMLTKYGPVELTQEDFDKVAHKFILEDSDEKTLKLSISDERKECSNG